MTVKVVKWPYMVMEVDHPNLYEKGSSSVRKLLSFKKLIKALLVSFKDKSRFLSFNGLVAL
jgi:hypothetical protein